MISVFGPWAQPACGLHSGCMLLMSLSLPILPDGPIELMMGLDAGAATKSLEDTFNMTRNSQKFTEMLKINQKLRKSISEKAADCKPCHI